MAHRILVAGIGNIFLGDDAFGVEVVRQLAQRELPQKVRVADFGIRGFDLTMALLEDFDLVILVDAVPRGELPGTLYLIEPDPDTSSEPVPEEALLDLHTLDPVKVLRLAKAMGGQTKRVLLVGCEPETLGTDQEWDVTPGYSASVRRAIPGAVRLIEALISEANEQAGLPFTNPSGALT